MCAYSPSTPAVTCPLSQTFILPSLLPLIRHEISLILRGGLYSAGLDLHSLAMDANNAVLESYE